MERSRILSLLLVICMILSMSPAAFAAPDGETQDRLVLQDLDYTENPVDIPNPDRGFERGNDDAAGCGVDNGLYGYMTVPASEDTILGQTFQLAYEMEPPLYLGGPTVDAEYCGVPVTPNIVQFYLVLNNFSSNAWCDSEPGNPSAHARTGVDGPITEYGLNFIREQLDFIRNNTNSVAHIRVCYDPKGWNQYVWTADNLLYEDAADPGSDRYYYPADYTRPVAPEDRAAHIAEPVAGTWRGSSPVFRMCTVPGYEDLNWVQYHYLQLKPIFEEYSDIIWAFDSGTFGPWGESHSNYEAEVSGHYKMLLDCLLDAVPDNKPIMTHIGGFLDWYNRTYDTTYTFGTLDQVPTPEPGTPEARFGMFDDSNGFSADEYSYGDNGSLTEGYRMLAHDPILPGYDPDAVDPSLTRAQEGAPGGKVSSIIGYNTTGTNRLMEVPEELDDPRWRGVWFVDWDRTKVMDFLSRMSVYGGEQIGNEPDTASNGKYVPVGERLLPENEAVNDVILRFPSMFYEHSIARYTYEIHVEKTERDPLTGKEVGGEVTLGPANETEGAESGSEGRAKNIDEDLRQMLRASEEQKRQKLLAYARTMEPDTRSRLERASDAFFHRMLWGVQPKYVKEPGVDDVSTVWNCFAVSIDADLNEVLDVWLDIRATASLSPDVFPYFRSHYYKGSAPTFILDDAAQLDRSTVGKAALLKRCQEYKVSLMLDLGDGYYQSLLTGEFYKLAVGTTWPGSADDAATYGELCWTKIGSLSPAPPMDWSSRERST